MTHPKTTFVVSTFLVLGSLLLVILLLEVGLRVTDAQPEFFYQLDQDVGAIHIPGKKGKLSFKADLS